MRERYGIIGMLLALGLSSCESTSGPALDGIWVLRSVVESPLPTTVYSDDTPGLVLSDTLRFGIVKPVYQRVRS